VMSSRVVYVMMSVGLCVVVDFVLCVGVFFFVKGKAAKGLVMLREFSRCPLRGGGGGASPNHVSQ
ncbi:hypothetical protein PV939_10360, partial [Ligilactobacillus salivarius]|nr:hypothetical protein [Ligilactobacillus salivarius]